MKSIILISLTLIPLITFSLDLGKPAPSFKLKGHDGNFYDLDMYKGKWVVLEWFNSGCPFVRKHYDSYNMQKLQKKYSSKVKWLIINSSAKGKQGHIDSIKKANKLFLSEKMNAQALLLDSMGKVGQAYSAKTTPHMYIINPNGLLVYQGAIDSIASASQSDIENSDNYVDLALSQALNNKDISIKKTRAYGCSVKY